MLQPTFLKGNAAAFTNPHTIILSAKMAQKFFGSTEPLGQTLRMDNEQDYTVIGVVKDAEPNVSIAYDYLAPVENFIQKARWLDNWATYGISTMLELRPGANVDKLNDQLTAILRPKARLYAHATCQLWSMTRWHLYDRFTNGQPDGGRITFIRMVSAIAWIIIVIACINFMNLATAKAGQRAREVGVRKTLGAMRKALIGQFLLESLLMAFVAVGFAIVLIYLFLPAFNTLVDKQLTFTPLKPVHLAALVSIGVFCGLIAGSYPAFYLSSFDPVAVLKGQRIGLNTGAGFIRKTLVVTQFTFSVGLIVCTVIINQQIQYVRSRDLGYNKEHLVYTGIQGDLASHFDALRSDLLQSGVVADAAISSSPPLGVWNTTTSQQVTWPGGGPDSKIKIAWVTVSPGYLSTMGLTLKEGRNFYPDTKADSGDIIINETLAKIIGKEAHPGDYLTYMQRDRLKIIGIVKDYLFDDMRGSVSPLMIDCEPQIKENYNFLDIRLKPGNDLPASLAKMVAVIRGDNPGYPVDYNFVDQDFAQEFTIETRIGEFAGIFSILAILISCLGLFGLAAYTAERRTKEIGIRKVLGASTAGLASLLSKEFLQLVTLACFIAFPLSWVGMNFWLKEYAYRMVIHWWIFALAGTAALLIALLTVSFLAIRAAMANPVNSLRTE